MSRPRTTPFARSLLLILGIIGGIAASAGYARAQDQERKLLDRIMHPNMDLHYDGFERSFDTKASGAGKQASIHPFGFGGRSPTLKTGDGAFHAKSFNDGRGGFGTGSFAVKPATAVDHQTLSDGDRSFGTRSVAVREDRAAGKSMSSSSRQYVDSEKPYLVPGKRQDTMDELRAQKNLTVDQVREILNKSR